MKSIAFGLMVITICLIAGCGLFDESKDDEPTKPSIVPTTDAVPETSVDPSPSPAAPTDDLNTATPEPRPRLDELKVHFIDVGQGDSILCDLGETEVLIDGSFQRMSPVAYLEAYIDEPLEIIVATNVNADYIGGLIQVLEAYSVKEVWLNGDTSASWTYRKFMDRVRSEGAKVHTARLHDNIQTGDLSFYVMHPAELTDDTSNNSIVLHLQYGDMDFLFMSDAEQEAESEMLMRSAVPIPEVEILKVGHHAAKTASSTDFLNTTRPEVAIYCCQTGNWYGHPHKETMTGLRDIGADIYGTDDYGTIIVTTNGKKLAIDYEQSP